MPVNGRIMSTDIQASLFSRLARLAACLAFIWFFFWVFTPFLVARWSALERYGAVQEEYNIRSGALYYTDVPVSADAERHNRDTIRFPPTGPGADRSRP